MTGRKHKTAGADGGAVGYGRPPTKHQFKKGQSGNPKGRPPKRIKAIGTFQKVLGSDEPTTAALLSEAYRLVKVRDGDQIIELPANQLVIRAMAQSAIKGNLRAMELLTSLLRATEAEAREVQLDHFKSLVNYKDDAEIELARRQALGMRTDTVLPHPDDIVVRPTHGIAYVDGPTTLEQKRAQDERIADRDHYMQECARLADEYDAARGKVKRTAIERTWVSSQMLFDALNDQLPERYRTRLRHRLCIPGASQAGDFDCPPEKLPDRVKAWSKKYLLNGPSHDAGFERCK